VAPARPKDSTEPAPQGRRRNGAPTLADVAREAGVSKMAASGALNGGRRGSARVSAETRERVLAVAEHLGYRPNATALALAHRRTDAVGVVTNFLGEEPNLYFLELFSGVIQGATAAGLTTSVFTLKDWRDAPSRIPALCDGRVDGLILLAPRLPDDGASWSPKHTPMVSVHAEQPVHGVVNIESDNELGAYEMVRHLLEMGHRRILHVGGPLQYSGATRRVDGYLRAYAEAGVPPPRGHVVRAPLTVEGGREAMQHWLQAHSGQQLPEAVFGGNDAIAFGCIEALRTRGLRVPEDVSVVGYDNSWMARSVQMATVHQPLHGMGRHAVEVLVQRIAARNRGDAESAPNPVVLPTEIVLGKTLVSPRRARLTIA
jgi:LacI family transcriptional regulator